MDDERPIPKPKNSVFAIWRWPRWTWAIVVPLAFAGYMLSAVPVRYFLFMTNRFNYQGRDCFLVAYAPVAWASDHSPAFNRVLQWEAVLMQSTFGELRPKLAPLTPAPASPK